MATLKCKPAVFPNFQAGRHVGIGWAGLAVRAQPRVDPGFLGAILTQCNHLSPEDARFEATSLVYDLERVEILKGLQGTLYGGREHSEDLRFLEQTGRGHDTFVSADIR
jgi:hypothetical protein